MVYGHVAVNKHISALCYFLPQVVTVDAIFDLLTVSNRFEVSASCFAS